MRHAAMGWLALCFFCTTAIAHDLRIEHVTVVSPDLVTPLRDTTVTIKDDRIVGVGPSAPRADESEVVNGTGLYLTPGLIDSHVHTSDLPGLYDEQMKAQPVVTREFRQQVPRSYLLFGYTTLVDLISTDTQAAAWNSQNVRPDLYFCGGAQIPGGYPPINQVSEADRQALLRYLIVQRGEEGKAPAGVDPATHTPEAVVSRMKADGALCVKTFYERGYGEQDELPPPRLETIRDLVKAAHSAHLPVLIHANSTDGQEFAVQAGADITAHGLWHWNREQNSTELTPRATKILDSELAAHMGWQPTMQVLYGLQDLFDPQYLSDATLATAVPASAIAWYSTPQGQWFRDILSAGLLSKATRESHDPQAQWKEARDALAPALARNVAAVRYMATHGGRILFGTDTPSAPTYANPAGLNGWREMHRLVDAGMTPLQVFRAATQTNAEALGLSHELGTVQVGKRANLLLLRSDPTRSVDAYGSIVKVILHGKVLEPRDLAANHQAPSGH
jgi:imidazolonepropionase-like amidohydrolase